MRLIDADADALIARINNSFGAVTRFIIKSILKDAPTIDAEPVRHGRWVDTDYKPYMYRKCSLCGRRIELASESRHHYCPNCGAKMDGDSHE